MADKLLFPVSGVETYPWLPPVVAFVVSVLTSMAGVSGALLLLPFQMSILGFVSPAVTATNLVYNVVATPGGVTRYVRERRMVWMLALVIVAGSGPGMVLGGLLRLSLLPDPLSFKSFAGLVLLAVGVRLVLDLRRERRAGEGEDASPVGGSWEVRVVERSWRRLAYEFRGRIHGCSCGGVLALSLLVGVVGGAYGIGGGALVAPFLVAVWRLPVHSVAGAALLGTFATSAVGVAFYELAAPFGGAAGPIAPDWTLGVLFGLGGLCGTALGARLQRFVPARWLQGLLVVLIGYVAASYLLGCVLRG